MATKQQIPVIAARLTEFQEGFKNLPTEDAQWVIMNGKESVDLIVDAVVKHLKTILGEIDSTFIVPATSEKFVAKDKFKIDNRKDAKGKIYSLDNKFQEYFSNKIEDPFVGSVIYGRTIKKNSYNESIIAELGGYEEAETTLTEMLAAMDSQPNGERGALLNNGQANVFYIKDVIGTLRAVHVIWKVVGWGVFASPINDGGMFCLKNRVFSRKLLAVQAA